MSSTVLARKHRPRRFSELVGQEHVVTALGNSLRGGRLHHAYLFTGTRGVGKTTVSRILAKSLNCIGPDGQGGITDEPCGTCVVCREIDAGRFVDYVELDAASNRGVDEISQLLEQSVYKPVVARFKVYMIDEVHMLTTHAFNAMLKTLEEPPEYLKFVLATTDPQKVPPTVLSRCLQFNLRPMAVETVQAHLADVLERESIVADAGSLRLIARAARGSMRDALSLTDQAIAYASGALQETAIRRMLGAAETARAVSLLRALHVGDGAALVAEVDALRSEGQSALAAADETLALLQRMAVWQVAPRSVVPVDAEEAQALALAADWPADELQLLYALLVHGRSELALAPDEHSGLMMVLLRALAFRPGGPPALPAEAQATGLLQGPATAGAATAAAAARSSPKPFAVAPPPRVAVPLPAAATKPPGASLRAEPDADPAPAPGLEPMAPTEPAPVAAPAADAAATTPAVTAAVSDNELSPMHAWSDWVRTLCEQGAVQALVRELALQAECVQAPPPAAVSGTACRVRLRVEREPLRAAGIVEKLRAALTLLLGSAVELEVEGGPVTDSVALRQQRRREALQQRAEAIIQDDPLVQSLMRRYPSARIVPGSVKPH